MRTALLPFAGILVLLAAMLAIPWAKSIQLEHRLFPNVVSYELRNAPAAPTRLGRVKAWLHVNRRYIRLAARRFRISGDAIAGLIAYEALFNVHLSRYGGLAEWSGPGKVHFKEQRFTEGDPISREVEDMGLLPKRSMRDRERLLEMPMWASLYIAASMRAFADIIEKETHHDISCNPGALVTLDTAWTLTQAAQHFAGRTGNRFSFANNFAGNWVANESAMLEQLNGAAQICSERENRKR